MPESRSVLARRPIAVAFAAFATALLLYVESTFSAGDSVEQLSISHAQIELMIDDGRVVTCASLKLDRCSDPDLEEAAKSDFLTRNDSNSNTYLLANERSGNVWALQISKVGKDMEGGKSGLSLKGLAVPASIARQWDEYLRMRRTNR